MGVANCHHVTYEFLKEQDAACGACVADAVAQHREQAEEIARLRGRVDDFQSGMQ